MSERSVSVAALSPTGTLDLDGGLSLIPRLKLHLTVHRSDLSVAPLDEWRLKSSLSSFLSSSLSLSVPEDDIHIRKFKDLKKQKREEPVAEGLLYVRDLGFVEKLMKAEGDDVEGKQRRFEEWRKEVVMEMDGIELNLEGVKFKLTVSSPISDDFERMRKEWEEYYAFGNRGNSRVAKQQPDTIVLRGVPSRWFAEPRVSCKASMLVTHTILSAFGKIRNLSVAEDNDFSKNDGEDKIIYGLYCKIVVQYEKYSDFQTAMKGLCGRSLQKEGSRLKADYEVTWDKDGFRNTKRNELSERSARETLLGGGSYRSEALRRRSKYSRYSPDNACSKRYRD